MRRHLISLLILAFIVSGDKVQDVVDKLIVSNEKSGQVASHFGNFMGEILHSLPRMNPYSSTINDHIGRMIHSFLSKDAYPYQGYNAISPPPSSIPYPVKLSDKVWIEQVINYIIGVAVISFIPLFFALFVSPSQINNLFVYINNLFVCKLFISVCFAFFY
jgi:hypothetical protein